MRGDAGHTVSDAGVVVADAGVVIPANPTLQDLANAWSRFQCAVYACDKRMRRTEQVCARASTSKELPYANFTHAAAIIEAGHGTYNQDKGNACADLLRRISLAGSCFGPNAFTFEGSYGTSFRESCGQLVDGNVAENEHCDETVECAGEGECVRDRFPNCVGQCLVWLHAGDACTDRQMDCGPKRFCDGTICRWQSLKANGEFCVDATECTSGKCFDYACKDASGLSGECISEGDCSTGFYCRPLPPSTGKQGICQVPVPPGGECGYSLHCAGNQSCAGYGQKYAGGNVAGACQAMPSDVGEVCVPLVDGYDYGDTGCFADLTCSPMDDKCEEPPALGAACLAPDGRCGLDAYCDATSICRARKGHGESAASADECLQSYDSNAMECYDPKIRYLCN